MPSVLQIISYAKEHLSDLIQVDSNKNDDTVLASVPDIFVPIRDGNIKAEDIKYIFAKQFDNDKQRIYRAIAIKEFVNADGKTVKCGEIGGFMDVKTYIGHKDSAWVDNTNVVFSSSIVGKSLVKNGSKIENCSIKNSIVEDSELRQAVRVDDSCLQEVIAEEYCSITKSRVCDSILVDRAHVERSKITGSRLTFCNVMDSELKNEKIMGDAMTLNMAKVYDYETILSEDVKASRLRSVFDLFKNKKIH